MIETLSDIITELADQIGIYGGCDTYGKDECNGNCRACWEHDLRARIEEAVKIEQKLYGTEKILS